MTTHLQHLTEVLMVTRANSLFSKQSKCVFAMDQVEYLGYIISAICVATDPSKIKAMKEWHVPKNVKELKGLLRFTSYYRIFINNFANIAQPLTTLLKKNAFGWNDTAQEAFLQFKESMIQALVLDLPDFEKEFVVETDASGTGLGVMLQQGGHPIAYIRKTLAPKHQHFKIKTDHFSLKYLLDQRLTTLFQTKWLPKLMGIDYEISYKKGAENEVADALSRLTTSAELNAIILSSIESELLGKVNANWAANIDVQLLIQQLETVGV
nr:hypothetical protein [Tanacetum cinerariifolium]